MLSRAARRLARGESARLAEAAVDARARVRRARRARGGSQGARAGARDRAAFGQDLGTAREPAVRAGCGGRRDRRLSPRTRARSPHAADPVESPVRARAPERRSGGVARRAPRLERARKRRRPSAAARPSQRSRSGASAPRGVPVAGSQGTRDLDVHRAVARAARSGTGGRALLRQRAVRGRGRATVARLRRRLARSARARRRGFPAAGARRWHRHPDRSVRSHGRQPPARSRATRGPSAGDVPRVPRHYRPDGDGLPHNRLVRRPARADRDALCREARAHAALPLVLPTCTARARAAACGRTYRRGRLCVPEQLAQDRPAGRRPLGAAAAGGSRSAAGDRGRRGRTGPARPPLPARRARRGSRARRVHRLAAAGRLRGAARAHRRGARHLSVQRRHHHDRGARSRCSGRVPVRPHRGQPLRPHDPLGHRPAGARRGQRRALRGDRGGSRPRSRSSRSADVGPAGAHPALRDHGRSGLRP